MIKYLKNFLVPNLTRVHGLNGQLKKDYKQATIITIQFVHSKGTALQ